MRKLLLTIVGVIWSVQLALATTCAGAIAIPAAPSFPYTQSLVCGATNDITSANATVCGNGSYLGGQESVYSWTPSVNYTNATLSYTGVTWSGIFVYAGCPTSGGTCVANVTNGDASKTLNIATFTAGVTYYFVFDTWPTPNSPCPGSFTLTVAPPANPATPVQLGGLPTCTTGAQLGFLNSTNTCSVSATASGNDNAATTATVTDFSCPTGTVTSANLTASIGGFCPSWYDYSIVVNGVTVATNQCNQSNFDLTPYLPLTSVSIVSSDNDSPDFITMNLTVNLNYNVPFSMPANVAYYWQTAPTGTSQAVPHVDPYYVFSNGTYYVRAYNTVTGLWSTGSSSVTVTNFPLATAPPAPVAALNPSCAPAGSTLTVAAAPVGYVYYWQGTTSNGVSTALNASTPYAYTTSGTYHVSAYETASQCWSSSTSATVTVDTYIPSAPIVAVNNYNVCSGATSQLVSATVPTFIGTNTYNLNFIDSWGDGWNGNTITVFVNGVPVLNNVTLTGGANGSLPFTVQDGNQITTQWNGGGSFISECTYTITNQSSVVIFSGTPSSPTGPPSMTVPYVVPSSPQPPFTLSWYDAATNGNNLGTGSPLETIGTSVLPTATLGSYNFYVGANLGGCQSATRQLVTVNVSDVNATLIPVNATCNGNNNGSFTLGTVQCGAQPFLYSVNGGAFSATIPTNLIAGTYSVVIEDDNGLLSSPISVIVTQPAPPANLTLVDANYFTADVSWTTTGNETQWNVEYGPVGFVPGTGTTILANTTSATLTNLLANTAYSFYVTAVCGTGAVAAGPSNFSTNPGFFTFDGSCGPGFTDISTTGTALNLTDDATIGIVLTSPITVQGLSSTNLTVSNNGWVSFAGITMNAWNNDWDDEEGNVYWQEMAIGGVNYLVVQWNDRPRFSGVIGQNVTFQILVNKVTGEVYYIYDDVIVGGSQASNDFGGQGVISLTGPVNITVSSNNTTYLTNNSCVHFYNALCPNPINVTNSILQEEVTLDWSAGLYGETEWTLIYGPSGFDPATSGTTINVTSSDANIFGLEQLTDYDVYIYSECTIDNLTSGGLLVSFQTLPWCANPTALGGTTAVDSLFSTWNFTPTVGAAQSLSGFNLQYGSFGFDIYSGTVQAATGINYADTVANPAFLAGGVYQVYVQAVCGTDTSNYSGPYTFVMPLSNDSVCGAEMLAVDGTVYTFNNTGATAQLGEGALITGSAPAGYNGTILPKMTWGSPAIQGSNWYTFIAPASGSMWFSGQDENFFASQIAIYELTDCSNFTTFDLVAASDQVDPTGASKVAPHFTICGLTPGATYYVLHDAWNNTFGGLPVFGQYSIKMTPINLEAGSVASILDVCTGNDVVLFDGLTGFQNGGVWSAELATVNVGITDSLFNSAGLSYQVHNFEYRVTEGCAYDSIVSQVKIFPPSSAGIDGTISVCKNQPYDLHIGLGGNVDLGGTWYDPSNAAMPSSSIVSSNFPGQYNYDYITGNGVCPDDTANVLVTVLSTCDYLDIQEMYFGEMSLLPNPTNGLVFITNTGSSEVFNYEITDIDGRIIATKTAAINGTSVTEINLNGKVTGMYMIRVYNDNAEKVFRVILQ